VREEEFSFLTLTVRVGISAASMMGFFFRYCDWKELPANWKKRSDVGNYQHHVTKNVIWQQGGVWPHFGKMFVLFLIKGFQSRLVCADQLSSLKGLSW